LDKTEACSLEARPLATRSSGDKAAARHRKKANKRKNTILDVLLVMEKMPLNRS